MSKATSPYYPPRAKWYSPARYLFRGVRSRLALERFQLPAGISISGLAGSLLVPGLGVYFRSRIWGRTLLICCAMLALTFLIALGYPLGNMAFGLLLSIHVSSVTYYCSPWLNSETLGRRMLVALLLTFCLGALIYFPIRNALQNHYFLPLRVESQVIVMHRTVVADVKRGDFIAYQLEPISQEGVYVHGGTTGGRILATAGDRVEFDKVTFAVNGVKQLRLPHMPASGGLVVPENCWFIWPNLATIGGHGNVTEAMIAPYVLRMANVSQSQFIGKPFKSWFGRPQDL
jgi:hypothetical protein